MKRITLQLGLLVVLIFILVSYIYSLYKSKKLKFNLFFLILIISIFYMLFDGITVLFVNDVIKVSRVTNIIFHALFLLSIDIFVFLSFYYLLTSETDIKIKTYIKVISFIPLLVNCLTVLITVKNLEFIHGVTTNYSMGVAVYTCYISVAVYVLMILALLIIRYRYLPKIKKFTLISVVILFLSVSLIQALYNEALISSIGVTCFSLALFFTQEDPALKEIKHYQNEMILGFATLVESRDESTGGHVRRTSKYVEIILESLMERKKFRSILTKEFISDLKLAAPMHDIGKVAIKDSILQKPGKLTEEEFEEIKSHTTKGEKIILNTFSHLNDSSYFKTCREVVLYHHEKWNGKGYPYGLKGDEIPLSARIMAVSDVFDAVSMKRCYRDALPLETCFKIILDGKNTDFDPEIVDAFISKKKEIIEVYSTLN